MNFKKRVNGSWTDTTHYIHNTSTDTLTTLPADIYANDTTATVGLKGQATQSGTPTPDSPVMPQGCVNKTANLFDEVYPNLSATIRYKAVYVGNGDFTLSSNIPDTNRTAQLFLLAGNVSSGASTANNGVYNGLSRTATSIDGYVTIAYVHYNGHASLTDYNVMLNTGSTAKPFEPFGVKLPISSADTTTPVYLGEVESTRRIKKLVLTGEEGWTKSGNVYYITSIQPDYLRSATITTICTHYQAVTNVEAASAVNVGETALFSKVGANQRLYIGDDRYANATEFTAYLAAQYAAGTPVTVWYVLATPETGIVNEPLMRIGDYADTLSSISIPVTAGGDTLSVGTTVQPSEVTVNYKGWHPVADVHERDNGAWT